MIKRKWVAGGVLAVVTILILASLILNGVHSIKDVFLCRTALENTYYLMQILCALVVILGGITGVWQYVLAKKAELHQYHNNRIQKAIELAEYYKDNVLCNMIIIQNIYDKSRILDILNSIRKEDMNSFDIRELDKNLSKQQKEEIKKILWSKEFVDIIIEAADDYARDTVLYQPVYIKDGDKLFEARKVNKTRVIEYFMNELVCATLNNLEFFAMHFNYEVADKDTVYQSLHQTYLEIVQLLYYDIATNNETGEQKLYTNVIELFNEWKKLAEIQAYKEADAYRNNIVKGHKAITVD
ncbi:MAG: hypothetical protein HFH87_18750 [Lachnospiraceae bacterium]|nr:hypothetical protein [Lachnospiraceae bacterium]